MTGISHVEIRETEPGVFFVKNTLNSKFVKMGIKEVEFLRLFESGADAKSLYQGELTEEQQDFLTAKFREWGFIEPQQHPDQPTEKTMMARLSRWKLSDLAIIRIVTLDPDPLLNRIAPLIQKLFHPAAIMIYVLLMMTAYGPLAGRMEVLFRLAAYQFTWQGLVLLYVLVIGTTIVHELAHALACKYYGGQVRRLGFMLFYLNPAMFCDVSDTYLFPRKGPKAVVLLAGIISQWILSALACLVYFLMEGTGHRAELLLYYAVTNIGLSLINLFPFVKLDGYWSLSQLLGIVNLRAKSFAYLLSFLSGDSGYREQFTKEERQAFLWYGIGASLFTPLLWGTAIYGLQRWIAGYSPWGGAAVAAVLILLLLVSFYRFIRNHLTRIRGSAAGLQA
ncbi:M50 family metallopeptidase [Paenibacillus sp. P26]|nr:M50 family metallopeptidase [Paenibacillus sp. P26]